MNADQERNKPGGNRVSTSTGEQWNALRLWPALVAGGACGLAVLPAAALELGALRVESALGQPLRASIAYALNQHEQLHDHCIYLRRGIPGDGVPAISRAVVSVSNGRIVLTGSTPINEPILGLSITVDCPYTANLTRDYTIMLNPGQPVTPTRSSVQPRAIDRSTAAPVSANSGQRTPAPGRSPAADGSPIPAGRTYQVRVGDTLSGIAERVANRDAGLWPTINSIFAANPDAFLNGDINLLKAGAVLRIPDSVNGAATNREDAADTGRPTPATNPTPAAQTYNSGLTAAAAEDPFVPETPPVADDSVIAPFAEPGEPASAAQEPPVVPAGSDVGAVELPPVPAAAALRPGDVIVGNDNGAASEPVERTAATPAAAPRTAIVRSSQPTGGLSWLIWLIGSGIALIAGVVYIARRYKAGFGSVAVGAPAKPERHSRGENQGAVAEPKSLSHDEMDYAVEETAADGNAFSLDADLGIGSGLSESDDIDVAQDFAFSTTSDLAGDLDLLLPEGAEDEPEANPTDIIAPHLPKMHSILESEVLPDSGDDYDLSMIVDATQQTFEDTDITERDLFAVPIAETNQAEEPRSFTISDDIGTRLIEEDYEKEHAATQAVDADIARAALELSERMDEMGDADLLDLSMDLESLGLDLKLPAGEELTDLDDTGINTDLVADPQADAALDDDDLFDVSVLMGPDDTDVTAETSARDQADETSEQTGRFPGRGVDDSDLLEELTVESRRAGNDATVEMDVESGRVNTKKRIG